MTTVEKLVIQVFDRKKWIIEQAKQQAEMYNHHVASKLLIDGIAPPSWLFTPTNHTSNSKELNKEEVVSRLLNPYPRSSVCRSSAHYPLYSNPPVGTGGKNDFSDGFYIESLVSNEDPNGQNYPPAPGISREDNNAGCTVNNVCDQDVSITSPVDQTDQRISCIYNAPDQSLARIQRSKSRQKALEVRSGAKSLTKNGSRNENINDNFRLSVFSTEQAGRGNDVPEGFKEHVFNEAVCQSKEKNIDVTGKSFTKNGSSHENINDNFRLSTVSSEQVGRRDEVPEGCSMEQVINASVCQGKDISVTEKSLTKNGSHHKNFNGDFRLSSSTEQVRCAEVPEGYSKEHVFNEAVCQSKEKNIDVTGKSLIKNVSSHENINDNFRLSIVSSEQAGRRDEVPEGFSMEQVINESVCQSKEKDINVTGKSLTKNGSHHENINDNFRLSSSSSTEQVRCAEVPEGYSKEQVFNESVSRRKEKDIDVTGKSLTENSSSHENINGNFRLSSFSTEQVGCEDEVQESFKKQIFNESVCQSKENDMDVTGKSLNKNGSIHENINGNFRLSIFSTEQVGHKEEVSESCKELVFNESVCQSKEKDINVTGTELGSTFDNCRKDVSLSRAIVGTKRPGSDFNSYRSDSANKLRKSGPSAVCFQSSVRDQEECQDRSTENHVSTKHFTSLSISCKQAGASSETESSDNAHRNEDVIMNHSPADYAFEPLVRVTEANVFDEGCKSHPSIAEDCKNEKGKETSVDPYYRMTGSSSSGSHNACADETSHQDLSSYFKMVDSCPFSPSSERLAPQSDGPSEEPGLVECSFGITDEKRDTHMAVGSELVLVDQFDRSASSSSVDTNRRTELESLVALSPTTSLVFAEPNELNIDKHKDYNLKIPTPVSGNERLNDVSEKTGRSNPDTAASADRLSIVELSKQSSDVHFKGGDGNCGYSEVQDEINIMHFEVEDTPDLCSGPAKLHLDHMHDALPVQHSELGNSNAACNRSYSLDLLKMADLHDDLVMKGGAGQSACGIHDETKQIHTEDCQALPCLDVSGQHAELTHVENEFTISSGDGAGQSACGIHDETKQIHTEDCQALPCLDVSGQHAELTHVENEFTISSGDGSPAFTSWPQLKRRKIHHQQETDRHTTSPCIKMKFFSTERCPSSTDLMNMRNDVVRVMESSEMETNQLNVSNLAEVESTFESQNGENQFCSKEQNEQQISATINEPSEIILIASPTKKRARNSIEPCVEEREGTHSSLDHPDAIDDNITNEKLTLNRIFQGTITSQLEDSQQSPCLVGSPRDNHQEFDVVDQSMPVYEGFMLDAPADSRDLECLDDEIDFDQLKLPSSIMERADVLAKICRSASTKTTPYSDSSSGSEFQSDLFKSVPNGLFKSMNTSFLPVNGYIHENLRFGNKLVNNVKDSFERMPYYSDSRAYPGARFGWNSRYLQASPVGKFSERLSSQLSSSGKRLSLNPDLTCFRIEEDFCVGDEIGNMAGDKREPLREMTNLGLIPSDTKYKDKECFDKQTSILANTGVKENQSFSFGAVRIKKSKESISNSVNKTVLRSKSSLNRPEQKLSLKESGTSNIVSHFSSFLPLVQPKKGTAPPGKREVKVKALETAEAAKRLEEEKENERKKKKEALKAERAKLEEKNLRQIELEKKRKEDERKKKDADILARKRLREEEERKEREKKRVRTEARQRHREQEEERVRAKKYEKENEQSKREKMNGKKELNEAKKPQNKMVRKDDAVLKNTEVKRSPATSEIYTENCGVSGQYSEVEKATCAVDKSPTSEMLIVQKSQEKSYEISPYQCSDDEDEEDDGLPTQKYVPSWASKSSVALVLPLQQRMDPDAIFRHKSCCSVDEVLFSRNVH